ncbi:MAG: WbqC family protein [Bacteroidota bacterium]
MLIDESINSCCLISTAYFPPIRYISKFLIYNSIILEAHENYTKQSYRNRCDIAGANGRLSLNIPVKREGGFKIPIRKVRIDNKYNWQKIHNRGLESAYGRSPFFEFYYDDVRSVIEENHKYLFDMNLKILRIILGWLQIPDNFLLSDEYNHHPIFPDFRNTIHPKKRLTETDHEFRPVEYFQVFNEKNGFIDGLIILDLVFNEGPGAKDLLFRCINNEIK